MASMISYPDHLRTLARLMHDADLQLVWPQLMEKAAMPRRHFRKKVLQCERLSGAEIKRRYQWPAVVPEHLKALKDMDLYLSVLILFESGSYHSGYDWVKGVFDLCGREVVLMRGEVFSPATLEALHFWHHHEQETRWTSRATMMADLAERVRKIEAAYGAWLREKGVTESIGLTRTKELLRGLEAGVGRQDLVPLLRCFDGSMLGYEDNVTGFEERGVLPPEFAERTYDLMHRLAQVSS